MIILWQPQQQLNTHTDETHTLETALENDLEYQWASSVAKAVGIVLHDWLQFNSHTLFDHEQGQVDPTQTIDQAQKQRWRSELVALNVPPEKINACLSRLEKAMMYMCGDDHARFIFKQHKEQKNEYALSCLENGTVNTYRIDRTFIDQDNVRWIIDYKTTVTQTDNIAEFIDQQIAERHHQQLQKYAELMSQMDARPIKLAVYFPLLKQRRVWAYQE